MLTASKHLPAGTWQTSEVLILTLPLDQRYRRRIALTTDDGTAFLLDLPKSTLLGHGDGLLLEDNRMIEIRAEPEELLDVRANDTLHMVRLAWHLGNRHLEAQLTPDRILIRRDPVIAAMLQQLGAQITEVVEPFTPETGAYGDQHIHHH